MQINNLDSGEALGFWEVAQSTGHSSAQVTWMPPVPTRKPAGLSLWYALRSIERTGSAWDVARAVGTAVMLTHRACTRYSHDPQLCRAALSRVFLVSPKSAREEKKTAENQCSCLMWTNDLPFGPQYSHGHPYNEILRIYFTAGTSKCLYFQWTSGFCRSQ